MSLDLTDDKSTLVQVMAWCRKAWTWLDFPDFKHDYMKEVYRSDMCFASRSPSPLWNQVSRKNFLIPMYSSDQDYLIVA